MAGWDLLLCFGSFCLTAEMFHLLGLLRKSIECWQSLEGKLKTAFLLIWKYSAPQLICVFTPNVSFVSYKARGSSRINESQYFYNIQRFSWESPRFTDGWNSTTWFVWVCFVVFFLISIFFFPSDVIRTENSMQILESFQQNAEIWPCTCRASREIHDCWTHTKFLVLPGRILGIFPFPMAGCSAPSPLQVLLFPGVQRMENRCSTANFGQFFLQKSDFFPEFTHLATTYLHTIRRE